MECSLKGTRYTTTTEYDKGSVAFTKQNLPSRNPWHSPYHGLPPEGGRLSSLPMRLQDDTATIAPETESVARVQLREIAAELETLRFRLLGVQAILPPSSLEETPLLETDEMDVPTEIRTTIGCVLEDRIGPAIRALQEV